MGFTQKELAEKTGVSLRTVQNWEGAESEPRGKDLRKVCEVLGVPISYLLSEPPVGAEAALHEEIERYGIETRHVLITKSPLADEIIAHFTDFMNKCGDDPKRLGWTLVKVQEEFPLDKWDAPKYEQRGRAIVQGDPQTRRDILDAAEERLNRDDTKAK